MKNRTVSARCFRLLALVSEVQNDVEVVKPILQELEVMRLSCALEMLSNVNVKDMEHEMLEASEFDDDFARFLRQELFGGRSGEDKSTKRVSVASAFGKQSEVKHHLQTLHAWDFGMEHHIREQEQGIYAVFLPDDSMSDENPPPKLVVFGWLVDSCFEPEHLRDTSTYILRFLTCLSSHVTCCLTKEDWPGLQAVMRAKDSSDMDNWNSYSVVFCVERQQDEEDSVEASLTQSLRLPRSITSEGLQLVKGKFPALVRCSAEAKTKRQTNRKHELDSPEEFALWMVDRAQQFELNWNRDDWQTSLKEALLHAADEWPGDTLKRIRGVFSQTIATSDEECRDRATKSVENVLSELECAAEVVYSGELAQLAKIHEDAMLVIKTHLDRLKSDVEFFCRINCDTAMILRLPFDSGST